MSSRRKYLTPGAKVRPRLPHLLLFGFLALELAGWLIAGRADQIPSHLRETADFFFRTNDNTGGWAWERANCSLLGRYFESKSVDRLTSFHILASSNLARSFFSAPL